MPAATAPCVCLFVLFGSSNFTDCFSRTREAFARLSRFLARESWWSLACPSHATVSRSGWHMRPAMSLHPSALQRSEGFRFFNAPASTCNEQHARRPLHVDALETLRHACSTAGRLSQTPDDFPSPGVLKWSTRPLSDGLLSRCTRSSKVAALPSCCPPVRLCRAQLGWYLIV